MPARENRFPAEVPLSNKPNYPDRHPSIQSSNCALTRRAESPFPNNFVDHANTLHARVSFRSGQAEFRYPSERSGSAPVWLKPDGSRRKSAAEHASGAVLSDGNLSSRSFTNPNPHRRGGVSCERRSNRCPGRIRSRYSSSALSSSFSDPIRRKDRRNHRRNQYPKRPE